MTSWLCFSLASCRLGGSCFCLHSLRQLVWWQGARLLGVVSQGEEEAVVELSLQVDRASHRVEVNRWSVCAVVIHEKIEHIIMSSYRIEKEGTWRLSLLL